MLFTLYLYIIYCTNGIFFLKNSFILRCLRRGTKPAYVNVSRWPTQHRLQLDSKLRSHQPRKSCSFCISVRSPENQHCSIGDIHDVPELLQIRADGKRGVERHAGYLRVEAKVQIACPVDNWIWCCRQSGKWTKIGKSDAEEVHKLSMLYIICRNYLY